MKRIGIKILKIFGRCLLGILLLVLLIVGALYIHPVQDALVSKVIEAVNKGGDMEISLTRFRLYFPAEVEVDSLLIKQQGDSMLAVGRADIDVSILPLFAGRVDVGKLQLDNVYYGSGTPDSTLCMRASVSSVRLNDTKVSLGSSEVDLSEAMIEGGRIRMAVRNDTTPPTPPSDVPWRIHAGKIGLKNIDFAMSMVSTGDSIAADLTLLDLAGGDINLADHNVVIDKIAIGGLDATYLLPDVAVEAAPEPVDTVSYPSVPWGIAVNKLLLDSCDALYGVKGAMPAPGLDMNYLQLSHIKVDIDSFSTRGSQMRVPVNLISATERCGLSMKMSGVFDMDSVMLRATDFDISTAGSDIRLNALYGMNSADAALAPVDIDVVAEISPTDLRRAMPSMTELIDGLPLGRKIELGASAHGTLADLVVDGVSVEVPAHVDLRLKGAVKNLTDFDRIDGDLKLDGHIRDVDFLKKSLLDKSQQSAFNIPRMTVSGNVGMHRGTATAQFKAVTTEGRLTLGGMWNATREAYKIGLQAIDFPVNSFLPNLGVGHLTANIDGQGHGLDIFSSKTVLNADVDVASVEYNNNDITNLRVKARIADSRGDFNITSHNPGLWIDLNATSNLDGSVYDWRADIDLRQLDLERLGMADTTFTVQTSTAIVGTVDTDRQSLTAHADINSLDVVTGATHIVGNNIDIDLDSEPEQTKASVSNHDLRIDFSSATNIDSLAAKFSAAATLLGLQLDERRADVPALQHALPQFELNISAETDNFVSRYLANDGTTFKNFSLKMTNDSLINMKAVVDSFVMGATKIDHAEFDLNQNGKFLVFKGKMDNNPGTWDDFAHVTFNGYVADDKAAFFMKQRNINDEVGYNVGGVLEMTDTTFHLKFVPLKPVIAYKQWEINKDNYLSLNTSSRYIDADLMMKSAESSLRIYTRPDSLPHSDGREDVFVDLNNIKLEDWLSFDRYSPKVEGSLDTHLKVTLSRTSINGAGTVSVDELKYGKSRIGDVGMNLDLKTTPAGYLYAMTDLSLDGSKILEAKGSLNDTTAVSPFLIDLALTEFPLSVANPFVGASTGQLGGRLNGDMVLTGSMSAPIANGYLQFDSAAVKVAMLGSTFRFSDEKIPVDSNLIRFNDFKIFGSNDNPLTINGQVDMRHLTNILLDLDLKARNWQVVKNDKRKGADVYGRAFINLDATAKGSLNFLNTDVSIDVLPETNVTYVMATATSDLQMQSTSDMVQFVNFADTTQVAGADTIGPPTGMMLNLSALLNIRQGSTLNVDLSADGSNKVQLKSQGTVDFTMDYMGDMRTTGRININGGFVRYTPPFMSEKLFDFQEGSYVAFNGDMMNPVLNIHAIDVVRANITSDHSNSRLIDFDVILNVTGTLETMDVAFDLSTNDDATVQNELQSMSAEQRANQAMNLLLYKVYTGPGTKGNASLSGNPLYAFLTSSLNSWMANNIHGVDISFGIDQYDNTVNGSSSQATSYSYRVSKSFMNDRFKIVVGGNYSTDDDADENLSQNLLNDISLEYMLNKSGSMYVKLFRHTGYESILEGEITQTGVGFVYKRKLRRVSDMFRFLRRRKSNKSSANSPVVEDKSESQTESTAIITKSSDEQ